MKIKLFRCRKNPNTREWNTISEKKLQSYWIEDGYLYHETHWRLTRDVYVAKIKGQESLSVAISKDEVLFGILFLICLLLLVITKSGYCLILGLFFIVLILVNCIVESIEMKKMYRKYKDKIYRCE